MNTHQELVKRLYSKKSLLEKKDPNHARIKTALLIDGGAMNGAFAAGVISQLSAAGFEDVFDSVIAVSSGTISASYFLAGQGNLAPLVFYQGLASKHFINLGHLRPSRIVGVEFGNSIFTTKYPLNQQRILSSRSGYFIGVTNPENGEGEYLEIKKLNRNIIDAMNASSAVPILHNRMVEINNIQYLDGMIACGIPINFPGNESVTDILIIENTPLGKPTMANPLLSRFFVSLFRFPMTKKTKEAIMAKRSRYFQTILEIEKKQQQGMKIGIIAPNRIPGDFCINPVKLKQTAQEGCEAMRSFLLQKRKY